MAKLQTLTEGNEFINNAMLGLPSHKEVKYESLPPHIKAAIPAPVKVRAVRAPRANPTPVAPAARANVPVVDDAGPMTPELIRHRLFGDPVTGNKKARFAAMYKTCGGIISRYEFTQAVMQRLDMTEAGFNTYFRTAGLDFGQFEDQNRR